MAKYTGHTHMTYIHKHMHVHMYSAVFYFSAMILFCLLFEILKKFAKRTMAKKPLLQYCINTPVGFFTSNCMIVHLRASKCKRINSRRIRLQPALGSVVCSNKIFLVFYQLQCYGVPITSYHTLFNVGGQKYKSTRSCRILGTELFHKLSRMLDKSDVQLFELFAKFPRYENDQ